MIVREGQKIGPEEERKLAGLSELEQKRRPITGQMFFLFLIFFAFITIVYEFADRNIKKFSLSEKDFIFSASLTVFTVLLIKVSLAVFERFAPDHASVLFYVFPLFPFRHRHEDHPFFRGRPRLFHHSRRLRWHSSWTTAFPSLSTPSSATSWPPTSPARLRKRSTMLGAGFFSALVMSFVMFLFHGLLGLPLERRAADRSPSSSSAA